MDDDLPESASTLPWLWVIEALSSCKEIDISSIHDLMEVAPGLPESTAKNAKEMVALRCLEGLFAPRNGNTNDVPFPEDAKVRFDPLESCEDVLQRILNETSESDLRTARREMLKWDVIPFITQKRTSTPKCALQQLKDTILDGTHPYADDLIGRSGLTSNGGLLPCKRDGAGSASQNIVRHGYENHKVMDDTDDNCNNVKKPRRKTSNLHSEKQNLFPLQGKEQIENSFERTEPHAETNKYDLERDQMGTLEGETVLMDIPDEGTIPKSCEDCSDELYQIQSSTLNNANIKAQDVYVAEAQHKNISVDEATNVTESKTSNPESPQKSNAEKPEKYDLNYCSEAEASSDSDGYRNERIDVMKKREFLSSQCRFNHDSSELNYSLDQTLCIKCNEGGRLLVCTTSNCPLVVHEKCIDSSTGFNDRGEFYCPYCAYLLAISEYLEAKKIASSAKKELLSFIHMRLESRPRKLTERLLGIERNNLRMNGDRDIYKIIEDECLGEKEGNQANKGDQDVISQANKGDQDGEHVIEVQNLQFSKHSYNKKQREPSESCVILNSQRQVNEANLITENLSVLAGVRDRDVLVDQKCQLEVGTERREEQEATNQKRDDHNISFINTEISLANEGQAEAGTRVEILQQQIINVPGDPACVVNMDSEEISEDDSDHISNYFIRPRRGRHKFAIWEDNS